MFSHRFWLYTIFKCFRSKLHWLWLISRLWKIKWIPLSKTWDFNNIYDTRVLYFKTVVRQIEFCNVQTIFVSRTMCGLVLNVKVLRTVRLWCRVCAARTSVHAVLVSISSSSEFFFTKKNKNRSNVFFRPLIFFALTHRRRRTFGNRKKTKLNYFIHVVVSGFSAPPECEPTLLPCRQYHFNKTYCYPPHYRCDVTVDCVDGSDEADCSKSRQRSGIFEKIVLDPTWTIENDTMI